METTEKPFPGRLAAVAGRGMKNAARSMLFLLLVLVPTTLAVAILDRLGILPWIAGVCAPATAYFGLPGSAVLLFASSAFLNVFGSLGVAGSLALNARELTILAVMCLVSHNLPLENGLMKKTGSRPARMTLLRLGSALFLGFLLNRLLPASMAGGSHPFPPTAGTGGGEGLAAMLGAWAQSTGLLALKASAVIVAVMILLRALEEFRGAPLLSRLASPAMKFLGFPPSSSYLLLMTDLAGYRSGAGILQGEIESGRMKPQDGDLFNHHAAISHSLLADTALFAVLGLSVFWLVIPRLALAILVVWVERIRRHYVRRSFRAGVA